MDGEAFDAGVFEAAGVIGSIDRVFVPAGADFGGDGEGGDGADDGGGDGSEENSVAEEGGAAVFADDFVDGAAEVEVDEVGLFPVDDGGGTAGQLVGVATEELHAEGVFLGGEVDILLGAFVAVQDALGGDELGGEDVGAAGFADAAEDGVGHAGHGGEKEDRGCRAAGEAGLGRLFHGNRRRRYRRQAATPSWSPRRAETSTCTSGTWARLRWGLAMRKVSPVPVRS